jgi:hypothetical protein
MIPSALRGRLRPALLVHHLRATPVPLVGAAPSCTVLRPFGGNTIAPTGTTLRPVTSQTDRPGCH